MRVDGSEQASEGIDRPRIFICWNEPDSAGLLESGLVRTDDILLQKLTSLGNGCEHVRWGEDELRVEGEFYRISQQVMDPYRFLAFRLFSLSFGRMKRMAYWLKALLVRVLIYRKKQVALHLEPRIRLLDDGIQVCDRLRGPLGAELESIIDDAVYTTIHMGSSRYFVPHELRPRPRLERVLGDPLDPTALAGGIECRLAIRLD